MPGRSIALAVVIVPQVAVPAADRIGPPAIVPIIEAAAFVGMLTIAAKPAAVPRSAWPIVLSLCGVLIAANTTASIRLVALA